MSYGPSPTEAAQTYQRRRIETADPIGLIVSVLELACENLAKARKAMRAGDAAAKGRAIARVSRALALLQSSLDMDQGDIATNLDRLYIYMQQRIVFVHLHNNDDALKEIAGHLAELTAAWRTAAEQNLAQPVQAAQPAQVATR